MVATVTQGRKAVVYVSGTPTTLTTEPTTKIVPTPSVYQITAATKRVLDPNFAQTQNWSLGPTGTITVNRLLGEFISTADETTHTLTITGKYLPMAPLLYCHDFSLSIKPKITDVTPFNQNFQSIMTDMNDVTGTLSNFYDPTESAALTIAPYFNTQFIANATIAIELYVNANLSLLAWAVISGEDLKAALDGVIDQTISWEGDADNEGRILSRL